MQVTMFQSAQGDCLLLTSTGDKTRILVDGGMPAAYTAHVAPTLTKFLKTKKKNIDLVYVSHIDQDHIGGVLRLLDDEVLWQVHEHQKKNGNPGHKPPKSPRPPKISAIWHNAFHEQVPDNAAEIEEALAASAPVLSASDLEEIRKAGLKGAGLATSIREAIRVSRRIGSKQLKIPLNAQAGGKLMMLRPGQAPIKLGQFTITVLGPSGPHLKKLRDKWNEWLETTEGKKAITELRKAARADEKNLGTSDFERLFAAMKLQADLQAEAFGDPKKVTPPNVASLTLLAEEGGTSILLTGDARWEEVIEGLEKTGRLLPGQSMSVDIVKVPHHGSTHNVGETDFLDRVIGKHYVFCGNGHSDNPEIDVVKVMVKHRLKAPGTFTFWFNCSEAVAESEHSADHMREVEKTMKQLAKKHKGRLKFKFLQNGSSLRVV